MEICGIEKLLAEHRNCVKENGLSGNAVRPVFKNVDGFDVYNPTAPFLYAGVKHICARVEKRDSEESEAVFFVEEEKDIYAVDEKLPRFRLQDPCLTKIGSYYILGGTETFPHPENPKWIGWRTTFYYGEKLENMHVLVKGPLGMKDVRLVELADGKIGVFTRPQGEKGGRGKIGFTIADDLSAVSAELMDNAPLLDLFLPLEWGGVNAVYPMKDGRLGVLGHIACFEPEEVRHYYPMAFCFNPKDRTYSQPVMLAERREFLEGPSKREDLRDVLFSGGLFFEEDKTFLYVGVSDCEVQYMPIYNPF